MYSAMEWGSLALRRLRGVRRTKSLWMSALYVRLLCSPALGVASQPLCIRLGFASQLP